ncbi:GNAT family protein [Psychrobacillus sp. FSL K6-2684]|uniref:GNAT family N-acetyltransferase n=1 Tax=unclassified Psychrobacillus TaxID=2636677 RepID=UPI001CD9ACAF|nr:GNAT family protein [Psychrobacillus sp. AK 1817]
MEKLTHKDVTLRLLTESDISMLWELYEPSVFKYMLNKIEDEQQLRQWLQAGIEQMNDQKNAIAYVVEHTTTKKIMGTTRIYNIDRVNHACEIGSTFYGKQYQRTHVNTTCKLLLLNYCFEDLGMIRVQFKTDELNLPSQQAIERIGGIREGVLRNERIRSDGTVRNTVVYSIVDYEWAEVKKQLKFLLNKYT